MDSQQQQRDSNPLWWDGIDDAGETQTDQLRAAATQQYLLDLAYFNAFGTPDGKKVLEHLWQNTVNSATWMPSLGYKKAIAHGFAREGQNALMRNIEQRIERVRNARTLDDYLSKAGVEPTPKPKPPTQTEGVEDNGRASKRQAGKRKPAKRPAAGAAKRKRKPVTA